MRFGSVMLDEAEGCILGHGLKLGDIRLQKGQRLGAGDIEQLRMAGIAEVVVARLATDDVPEDIAATSVVQALKSDHLRFSAAATGRINIHAAVDGVFVADRDVVDRLNRVDPAITLACLSDHVPVAAGDMVATVKIIPLAVAASRVAQAVSVLQAAVPFRVKPFVAASVTLIATVLPHLKPGVMDKTRRTLTDRLRLSGSRLAAERRVPHTQEAVAEAIVRAVADCDLIVVFGASAVADPHDVIPAAIRLAGGAVDHVGMPVDPGNLLVLGHVGTVAVVGAPGCARSPTENGFDWILNRILVGEWPTTDDITGMGVGGLLMEIPTRPQPRDLISGVVQPVSVAIAVLAAGRSSRMGPSGHHKLLAEFDGVPLIRRSVQTALDCGGSPVVVVTGHRAADMRAALFGLDCVIVDNSDHASGMASSLIAGLDAAGTATSGLLVLLADMPAITPAGLRRMIEAFDAAGGVAIVRAVSHGKRGNPVILPRATFPAIRALDGDVGARQIIETCGLPIIDVDLGDAAHLDLDTVDAVLAAGGVLKG